MKSKAFEGVWIPKEVLCDENLTLHQKVIFSMIQALSSDQPCYAGNEYFADQCGTSTRSVSGHITKLKDLEYIDVDIQHGSDGKVKQRIITTRNLKELSTGKYQNFPLDDRGEPLEKTFLYHNKEIINKHTKGEKEIVKEREVALKNLYKQLVKIYPARGTQTVGMVKGQLRKSLKDGATEAVLLKAAEDWKQQKFHYSLYNWLKEKAWHKDHPYYPVKDNSPFAVRDMEYR